MEQLLWPSVLCIAGTYFLVRNIVFLRDETKLVSYLQESPKAKLWVNKFGVERTTHFAKAYFLPLGLLVSTMMLGVGLWSLSVLV